MSQFSAFDLENDDGLRRVLYLSAFLLFFMPYFQALAGLWPLQLGSLQWRFQATGAMSVIMMLPFLGLVLALAIARPVGHKGVQRLVGTVAALTAVGLIIALGLFAMDALQLKKIIRDAQMNAFNKAVLTATFTLLFSLCTFSVLSVVAFRSPRGSTAKAAPKSARKASVDQSPGLLIGQDYTKE
ncbi:MAG: hypothetical protein ABI120_21745 [Gemmatimonadaceae bacterium]